MDDGNNADWNQCLEELVEAKIRGDQLAAEEAARQAAALVETALPEPRAPIEAED